MKRTGLFSRITGGMGSDPKEKDDKEKDALILQPEQQSMSSPLSTASPTSASTTTSTSAKKKDDDAGMKGKRDKFSQMKKWCYDFWCEDDDSNDCAFCNSLLNVSLYVMLAMSLALIFMTKEQVMHVQTQALNHGQYVKKMSEAQLEMMKDQGYKLKQDIEKEGFWSHFSLRGRKDQTKQKVVEVVMVTNKTKPKPFNRFCHPGADLRNCTHHRLTYNLAAYNDPSMILLEDLPNLLFYKPETICNARLRILLEGLLPADYPKVVIQPESCGEDFFYYGYHHLNRIHHQVQNRARLYKFPLADIQTLVDYIKDLTTKKCSHTNRRTAPFNNSTRSRVLYINRNKDTAGLNIPKNALVPAGADEIFVDGVKMSLLDILCTVQQYDLVVVPPTAEQIFPILMEKPYIKLRNNWTQELYFGEITGVMSAQHTELFMSNEPWARKPTNIYFNNFKPTPEEINALRKLVEGEAPDKFTLLYPLVMRDRFKGSTGMIDLVRKSRQEFLDAATSKDNGNK